MALPPRSMREHLRRLVGDKNQWSRLLTDEEKALGFLGWHERGYLPHCDFPDLIQFITFRLADSMPASRRGEWEHLLKIEDVRERRAQLEEYLDRGVGECLLRCTHIAQIVEDALLCFHGKRYELLAWCVMPNHVHVLVDVKRTPLWKIVQSWKRFTATETERRSPTRRDDSFKNAPARRAALQWQREYWDTFMRDEAQERRAIQYNESYPVKAKLCRTAKEWLFSSARFRDNYAWIWMCEQVGLDFANAFPRVAS
jgi:type I restriction enzyme R subunit/putative DNA methylase